MTPVSCQPQTALTREDEIAEYLMMGMRLYEGIDLRRYEMLAGAAMDSGKINASAVHWDDCAGRALPARYK